MVTVSDTPACFHSSSTLFFLILLPPPRSTLFPYTTLFRSSSAISQTGSAGGRSISWACCSRWPSPSRCSGCSTPRARQWSSLREGERSEEHTSELQSLTNLVCRLLLEKNNKHR